MKTSAWIKAGLASAVLIAVGLWITYIITRDSVTMVFAAVLTANLIYNRLEVAYDLPSLYRFGRRRWAAIYRLKRGSRVLGEILTSPACFNSLTNVEVVALKACSDDILRCALVAEQREKWPSSIPPVWYYERQERLEADRRMREEIIIERLKKEREQVLKAIADMENEVKDLE